MVTFPNTALWRLQNYYNGGDYHPTSNPGGMNNNGHSINWMQLMADIAEASGNTSLDAALAAAAASQQESWGPMFTTASGGISYVGPTTCRVDGDILATMPIGSHVAADCGADGYRYGVVSGVAGSTVTVSLFSGVLTANLCRVYNVDTRMIYITDYLDVVAAQTSCAASQDASLASERNAAAHEAGAQTAAIAAAASSMATAPIRDTLGKFVGVIQPGLNLFCPDMTSDTAPIGTFTRSTGGYRMGPTGLYEWVAGGLIRREWDYNGNLLGWLLEGGSTNLLPYSQEFENAAWGKTRSSITPNAAIAPDGTMTADKLVEDTTANNSHKIDRLLSPSANTTYCISCYMKAAERTIASFTIDYGLNGVAQTILVNLSSGTASISSGTPSYKVVYVGNGWYRVWLSATSSSSPGTTYAVIYLESTYGDNIYTGDGISGLYIWGVQLEAGAIPTSYIPTTSAAVARAADWWAIPTSAFPFNANEGAIYFNGCIPFNTNPLRVLYSIDSGSYTDRVVSVVQKTPLPLYVEYTVGGTDQALLSAASIPSSTPFRLSTGWAKNSFASTLNGGGIVSDTSGNVFTGATRMVIGSDWNGANSINGHLRHLAYFPRRLSDAALQSIAA